MTTVYVITYTFDDGTSEVACVRQTIEGVLRFAADHKASYPQCEILLSKEKLEDLPIATSMTLGAEKHRMGLDVIRVPFEE